MVRPALLVFVVASAALAPAARAAPDGGVPGPAAAAVAPGVTQQSLHREGLDAEIFRVDLARATVRLVAASDGARAPVSRLAEGTPGAVVATNASFFDPNGHAMGVEIDAGRPRAGRALKAWGAVVIAGGRARLLPGGTARLERGAELEVQGTPTLLVGGRAPRLKPQRAARTALCAQGEQLVVVVTSALTLDALAALLRDELGCSDALNLDGGPSTQLWTRGGPRWVGQSVPNALVVVPR